MQRGFFLGMTFFWGNPNKRKCKISFYEISRPVKGLYGIAFGGKFFGVMNIDIDIKNSTAGLKQQSLRKRSRNETL